MKQLCTKIRKDILEASYNSGHGHIPTSFSVVEILIALYQTISHDPNNPDWSDRDYFILSKGHASLSLYAILAEFGYFSKQELLKFGGYHSMLGCHTDRAKIPGIEWGTGSLGHGIGAATGLALALKQQKRKNRVYTLIGDGESNEGSVWEAAMIAAHHKLDNLTLILDNNNSQTRCLPLNNAQQKFHAFGLETSAVDGHNVEQIIDTLKEPQSTARVIIANTTKGYGSETLTNEMFAWHRRSPNKEELSQLIEEVNA